MKKLLNQQRIAKSDGIFGISSGAYGCGKVQNVQRMKVRI